MICTNDMRIDESGLKLTRIDVLLIKLKLHKDENQHDWDLNSVKQVEKLVSLIESGNRQVELNGEEYGVYNGKEADYGHHEGKIYTIEIGEFLANFEMNMESWMIPTVEGVSLDINLIK